MSAAGPSSTKNWVSPLPRPHADDTPRSSPAPAATWRRMGAADGGGVVADGGAKSNRVRRGTRAFPRSASALLGAADRWLVMTRAGAALTGSVPVLARGVTW